MRYLLLFLIIVPAAEIAFLLLSGKTIGVLPTMFLLIFTGVLGAYLAKRQGLETIRKAQEQLRNGQIPGDALLDGICILIGGTLLLTPGFITDVVGFLLLAPLTRKFFKRLLIKAFKRWIDKGTITIIR
ncbi:FxsA family protein [Bacillus methanolicus]|uniref:Phage T7 F exclusion suppressor FxsA n=1 Tax=Bacillus methanolicus (strain MGA3 / ATCC 53907) TaxID=796606 RepID=I3ECK0_BACMM|nr:FxsA family protein [Bacillus methanolicus]AIE61005.1 phage T7 F exclusion suppressor FxsA [Bacillus methanolicus MGA3]EIJ84221.1 FxsA [Bacillus methanolicus MGA3]UQD52991.1 membrane protein FxsA [Bacillus methanolicus]